MGIQMNKKVIAASSVILAMLIVAVIVVNRGSGKSEEPDMSGLAWYKGGNLHESTVLQWKEATFRNQLATCASFVYFEDRNLEAQQFKERSMELRDCIDEISYQERSVDISDQRISTIAASCSIDLGHKRDAIRQQAEEQAKKNLADTTNL